jgi:molybdopterin-binding protein
MTLDSDRLTRTQAARVLGVAAKTLYTWEKEGKIAGPARDDRGWRYYTQAQIGAIRDLQSRQGKVGRSRSQTWLVGGDSGMRLSARNVLWGTVTHLVVAGVTAEVSLTLGDGQEITSIITRGSAEALGLAIGRRACAVVKATEVMIGADVGPPVPTDSLAESEDHSSGEKQIAS